MQIILQTVFHLLQKFLLRYWHISLKVSRQFLRLLCPFPLVCFAVLKN